MTGEFYADDVKLEPIWWEAAPRPHLPPAPVPERADAAIVGSGYTGLCAALTLLRGGRSVVVFEAGRPGEGASSRNGGGFGLNPKLSFGKMAEKYGLATAEAVYRGVRESWSYLVELVAREGIACHLMQTGRFTGAHVAKDYEAMGRDLELQRKHLGVEAEMVPRAEQHRVIGTDHYHGGMLWNWGGHLHPALFHQGLLEKVLAAGGVLAAETPVTRIARDRTDFTVFTAARRIQATDVVIGTNGYSGPLDPWLRRRLIPIQSQMIATEPLAPERVARLLPGGRMMGDTCNLKHYYRPSPDGRRVLFGGRAGGGEINDPSRSGVHLHKRLVALFPDLEGVRITHSWAGFIAYTFDFLPHIGRHDGIHYGAGYCGSGVSLASYFGHKIALRILGSPDAATAFDGLRFATRPLYYGNPWFMPPLIAYFGWRDMMKLGSAVAPQG